MDEAIEYAAADSGGAAAIPLVQPRLQRAPGIIPGSEVDVPVVPVDDPAAALILPCTLIVEPANWVVPGAKDMTQSRVLSGYPRLSSPVRSSPLTNCWRWCAVSRLARASGRPPRSVCGSRSEATSSFFAVW